MTDKSRETLSALMDGEASEIEVHRLLREMDHDPNLRTSWLSYQQIRSVIRREAFVSNELHAALAERLRASIAGEELYDEPEGSASGLTSARYFKPVVGFAVAASLVGAILIGVQTSELADRDALDGGLAGRAPDALTDPAGGAGDYSTTAPSALPALRSGPTTLVSASPQQSQSDASGEAQIADPFTDPDEEPELRELDEERMQYVRAYLMRHDRVARMNPYARVVTNPTNPGD